MHERLCDRETLTGTGDRIILITGEKDADLQKGEGPEMRRLCSGSSAGADVIRTDGVCLQCRKSSEVRADPGGSVHMDAEREQFFREPADICQRSFRPLQHGMQLLRDFFYALPDGTEESAHGYGLGTGAGVQGEGPVPGRDRIF